MSIPGRSRAWPWWRRVLIGLNVLALALCAYLSWHYLLGGSVIGCNPGSGGCNELLTGRWSAIGVLPVSGLAAGVYLAMLVASLFIGPATAPPDRRLAWGAMLVLVGAAAGSAVWFIIVQRWIIGAFCPYCMATHITGLLLAALVIWRAPKPFDKNSANPPSHIAPFTAISLSLVGLALAGILAVSQVAFTPRAVYRDGTSQQTQAAIDLNAIPLVGSPDAPYIVTLLFDYQCPHCQQMHFMLDEVIRRYRGKLAIALRPTPLDSQCNPHIPRDVDHFKDSCELAKTGLAVWLAKRETFPEFDRWMFSLESGDRWRPRALAAARAKAVELVGQSKFDAARADPWIDQYLQSSVKIFGDTGAGGIPKLVFGSHWVIAQPYDAEDFISLLRDSLAVPGVDPPR
jgi:uncharacterized membrane protein